MEPTVAAPSEASSGWFYFILFFGCYGLIEERAKLGNVGSELVVVCYRYTYNSWCYSCTKQEFVVVLERQRQCLSFVMLVDFVGTRGNYNNK